MANVSVGILGLGRMGAAVGLALKRYNQQGGDHTFNITGYDSRPNHVKTAQKINAVDNVTNRPHEAVKNKDIVVMALPYAEVKAAYEFIQGDLRAGVVIMDMSVLKQTSLAWADKNLPAEVHVVSMTAIVNPKYLFDGTDETERATEDYFDNGVMMVMPSVKCIPEAVNLASDFAAILGAKPHFADPAEHDALVAGTEALPAVLGVTYFHSMMQNKGWLDSQRFTNPGMGMLTRHLFDSHPDDLRDLFRDSKDDLLRHLDRMIARMTEFREALAKNDRDALESLLESTSGEYEAWINRRYNNRWQADEQINTDTPTMGGVMGNMFGGFLTNRGDKKKDT